MNVFGRVKQEVLAHEKRTQSSNYKLSKLYLDEPNICCTTTTTTSSTCVYVDLECNWDRVSWGVNLTYFYAPIAFVPVDLHYFFWLYDVKQFFLTFVCSRYPYF